MAVRVGDSRNPWPWESIPQRGEGEQTSDVSERRVDRGAQPGRAKLLTREREYL